MHSLGVSISVVAPWAARFSFDTFGGVYVFTRLLRYELDEVGVSLL